MGGNGGIVEPDETFIGDLAKNMHKSKRAKKITGTGGTNKTAVMGLLERHTGEKCSQVCATVVERTDAAELHRIIHKHVELGTQLYTDVWRAYRNLDAAYSHSFVDHAERYVDGAVHTNGLENFWALLQAVR